MSSKENATTEETSQLLETVHKSEAILDAAKEIAEIEEKAKDELDKIQDDVKDLKEHAEKQIDKTVEELRDQVEEAHEDAADELASLKEDVKEKVEKHSGIVALALYLCGCVSMLWKQKESNKCANEKCECDCGDKIEPKDVEEKIENKK